MPKRVKNCHFRPLCSCQCSTEYRQNVSEAVHCGHVMTINC